MKVTPIQAESMWCPMVRQEGDCSTFNRGQTNSNPTNADDSLDYEGNSIETRPITKQVYGCHCVADKCMMWRWYPAPGSHLEQRVEEDGSLRRIVSFAVPNKPTEGFCGIAGNLIVT